VRLFWLNLNAPGGWLVLAFTGGIDFIPQKWYHWNLRIKSVRVLCDFQSAARSMMPFSCNTFFSPKGESCKSEKQAPVAANDDIRVDILPECVVGVRKYGCVAKMRTTTSPAPWRASLESADVKRPVSARASDSDAEKQAHNTISCIGSNSAIGGG
jgi:hypothetical protein